MSITVSQFDKDVIEVVGKGNKKRSFRVTNEVRQAFNDYIKVRSQAFEDGQGDNGLLFVSITGKEMYVKDINKNLRKYCERANIVKDITSHCLRRSCATHYLNEGVPVAQIATLLGHSDVKTTMRYYKEDGSNFDFLGLNL